MFKDNIYPFMGIVGQDKAKQALLVALINPKVGGVLLVGNKGCGKSVLVRSCADLVPEKILFNVPLNTTEDMLFGSIDIEYALKKGRKKFSPGLLARANNNILYIDDINLLRNEFLTAILDSNLNGHNLVERDGVSFVHDVNMTILGTMNLEEGNLPKHILDRFGLYVDIQEEHDIEKRVEIIKNRLAYENNPHTFSLRYNEETKILQEKIVYTRQLLTQVNVSEAMLLLVAQFCAQGFCAGHRAEIYLIETAKTLAAWNNRTYVLPNDIEKAAEFVLPHRVQQPPEEQLDNSNNLEDESDNDLTSDNLNNDLENNSQHEEDASNTQADSRFSEESNELDTNDALNDKQISEQENTFDIDKSIFLPKIMLSVSKDSIIRRGSGKRSITKTDLKEGRYVRAQIPHGKTNDLAFDATIRAAAPYQKLRKSNGCAINITTEDLRQKVREKRIGNIFLFVVDASGSMGAKERMRAVKGAIFCMLQEAYQKRDRVGMIAFRRHQAELLLPITRSVDLAQKCLAKLPTGGKTPLGDGLQLALQNLKLLNRHEEDLEPILVLVTDGRANVAVTEEEPVPEALKFAEKIGQEKIMSVVIDTESDFIKLGLAKEVAYKMGASYYTLQKLSQENILRIVRNLER